MTYEDLKCGDDCKLVEMLATKTSKQQAMENAIAAVKTGNISVLGAAKRFGVPETSLRRKMKLASDVRQMANHTTQESKAIRSKPTDEERQEWWDMHVNDGLTANAIHKKTGRNRETISKEIKRREGTGAEIEPTPTTAPAPTPAVEQWADDPCLHGWNGKLNDLGQKIYRREKVSSKSRAQMAEQLAVFKLEIEKSMRAASKNHRIKAGKLLEADVKMVEATLQREGRSGIKETLEAVLHEAERIQKFASETLRILQLRQIEDCGIAKT